MHASHPGFSGEMYIVSPVFPFVYTHLYHMPEPGPVIPSFESKSFFLSLSLWFEAMTDTLYKMIHSH